MQSELRILAGFVAGLSADKIPPDIMRCASERVLDNVSAALAAANEPLLVNIRDTYRNAAGDAPLASVWGHPGKYPLVMAAFINSMMCHTLELDDVHAKSKSHIGTVVIPAAWAMAEYLGAGGRELLTAIIAGYEVESRIAMSLGVKEHRKLGWHVTATAGVFGAAAACGKLLGLDTDTMVSCLGLAGAQSFGSWAFLSGDCNCKALNPARACATGCEAALLALSGMRGPENILTAADGGLYSAMTSHPYPELLTKGLGEEWEIAKVDSKPYPCCRSTHCAIDGVLALKQLHQLDPAAVSEIQIATYLIGKQQCAVAPSCLSPANPAEAKFSLPYCAAAALLNGTVSLADFQPDRISRIRSSGLMEKVSVTAEEEFTRAYPEHWGCRVAIRCRGGALYETVVPDASGSVYYPLSGQQMMSRAIHLMEKDFPREAALYADLLKNIQSADTLPPLHTNP